MSLREPSSTEMRNYYSYFIIISLLFPCSLSFTLIDHYCHEASKNDPNLKYDFCVKSLESNPKSQNVATLEELTFISIELTMSNATNIRSYISHLLESKNLDTYTRGALKDCLELYLDANSTLNDAMSHLIARDYYKANLDLSAAMDSSDTCEDGFEEKKGEVSPLTKENSVFFQLDVIGLAFTKMLSS